MPTMKAKKGNPFEYDVMYSLSFKDGIKISRPDTNIQGIDLIAEHRNFYYLIECKNRNLNWNTLNKIYKENENSVLKFVKDNNIRYYSYYIVFKPKRTEVLVFHPITINEKAIVRFKYAFDIEFNKRPKGFNLNKLLIK